jgi:hypothetical protein
MKKIRLILSAVLMMTAFGFIACSHSASGSNVSGNTIGNDTGSNTSNVTDGIRLQNGASKQVGDIILNDGTVLRDTTSVSDTDKAKAIAVIYKVTDSKAYGVGLVHNKNGLKWCLESANGHRTIFTDLQCTVSGDAGNYSFTGDIDGSDNFTKIAQTLGANDDTEIEGNYPAFEFAKNYKSQTNSHVNGTTYESGWYLPTLAELYDIWKVKDTIDAKSSLCGGSQFGNYGIYWSSSQDDEVDFCAYLLFFDYEYDGNYYDNNKHACEHVCCIRVFE